MYCYCNEIFECYQLSKNNAEVVLNRLGFPVGTDTQTGRYGKITEKGITWGYKSVKYNSKSFGNYLIIRMDRGDKIWVSEEEFNKRYTIIDYEVKS